jgi:heparan-alpha-glucosaminide N-acetyltransferase
LLNLFPHEKPFVFSGGGYQTLNFVPSITTMIFGLLAGQLLRTDLPITEKTKRLALLGIAGIIIGQAVAIAGLCPIVKRIWTPSWAIYSAGWVALLLAGFVAVIEWRGWKRWAFPFVVVGLNPITLYCMWQLMTSFVRDNIRRHLGRHIFESLGAAYVPMLERAAVLLVLWLILLWMYRRKVFLRI